jgi:hypothetical protein
MVMTCTTGAAAGAAGLEAAMLVLPKPISPSKTAALRDVEIFVFITHPERRRTTITQLLPAI